MFLLISEDSVLLLTPFDPALVCESCGKTLSTGDFPFCPHESTAPHRLFPSFEYEGRMIDSIQAADKVERESENRARNEPGAAPIRFRAFHQDQSNYDVNTFGPSPQVKVPKRQNLKGGFGDKARDREVHPAVRRIRGD